MYGGIFQLRFRAIDWHALVSQFRIVYCTLYTSLVCYDVYNVT